MCLIPKILEKHRYGFPTQMKMGWSIGSARILYSTTAKKIFGTLRIYCPSRIRIWTRPACSINSCPTCRSIPSGILTVSQRSPAAWTLWFNTEFIKCPLNHVRFTFSVGRFSGRFHPSKPITDREQMGKKSSENRPKGVIVHNKTG